MVVCLSFYNELGLKRCMFMCCSLLYFSNLWGVCCKVLWRWHEWCRNM